MTRVKTQLTKKLGIDFPIIQAPMAGGITTPELVAAVSNSGGLGSVAGGYLSTSQLRDSIQKTKQLTNKPFAVNLFVPQDSEFDNKQVLKMKTILMKYGTELGLAEIPFVGKIEDNFDEQMNVILQEKPIVFSFTFGIPPAHWIRECKKVGIFTLGTATHLGEAQALEEAGIDIVCAQGFEAGGHRGTFIGPAENGYVGTFALVSQLTSEIRIPIVAAGGIMDGHGILAALALGAEAAQMGTAFLLCPESGTSQPYRNALLDQKNSKTQITRVFSGREARGIENQFLTEMEKHKDIILPYPIQNSLTQEIRKKAAQSGRSEFLSLWAGQSFRLAKSTPAKELIAHWTRSLENAALI